MCLVLYLGTDSEVPLIPPQDFAKIDSDDPAWPLKVVPFSVEIMDEHAQPVSHHFSTRNVRYAGSFEGCGCGYNSCLVREWEVSKELSEWDLAGRESRRKLREYVDAHGIREIYACWSGDETLSPTAHVEIESEALTDFGFEIPERVMMRLSEE